MTRAIFVMFDVPLHAFFKRGNLRHFIMLMPFFIQSHNIITAKTLNKPSPAAIYYN